MSSSTVLVCVLLVTLQASALASSVPAAQRGRGAKIDSASGSFFSGGFHPSVAVPERRSDNYQAASGRSDAYQTAGSTSYESADYASYQPTPPAHATPRFFDLGSLFYGLQANWPAVLIAAVLVIGTIIIVPWIASKVLGGGNSGYLNLGGYGRSEDGAASASLMSFLDEALQKYDVDATACMQQQVCSYVRKAALDVVEGRADSTDLLVDGLSSNSLLTSWLDGTSILEASNVGRSGADCAQSFSTCSLNADTAVRAIQDLVRDAQ